MRNMIETKDKVAMQDALEHMRSMGRDTLQLVKDGSIRLAAVNDKAATALASTGIAYLYLQWADSPEAGCYSVIDADDLRRAMCELVWHGDLLCAYLVEGGVLDHDDRLPPDPLMPDPQSSIESALERRGWTA